MKKSKFTETQIVSILEQADAGVHGLLIARSLAAIVQPTMDKDGCNLPHAGRMSTP